MKATGGERRHRRQWDAQEEQALLEGVRAYGVGSWKRILQDDRFSKRLSRRKNVDLKDKWRVINGRGTIMTALGPTALAKAMTMPNKELQRHYPSMNLYDEGGKTVTHGSAAPAAGAGGREQASMGASAARRKPNGRGGRAHQQLRRGDQGEESAAVGEGDCQLSGIQQQQQGQQQRWRQQTSADRKNAKASGMSSGKRKRQGPGPAGANGGRKRARGAFAAGDPEYSEDFLHGEEDEEEDDFEDYEDGPDGGAAAKPVEDAYEPIQNFEWEGRLTRGQADALTGIRSILRRCALKSDQLPTCITEVWAYAGDSSGATAAPEAGVEKEKEQAVHLLLVYRLGGEWDQLYARFIWLLRSLNELKQLRGSRVLEARRTARKCNGDSGVVGVGKDESDGVHCDEKDIDDLLSVEDLIAMNTAYQRPLDALDDALRAHSRKFDAAQPREQNNTAPAPAVVSGVDDSLIISDIVNTTDASYFRSWVSTLDWDMCENASDAIRTPPCKHCQEHITATLLLGGLSGVKIGNLYWRGEEAVARLASSQSVGGRPVYKLWGRREGGGSGAPSEVEASLRTILRVER